MENESMIVQDLFDEADDAVYESKQADLEEGFASEINEIEAQESVSAQNQLAESVGTEPPKASNVPLQTIITSYAQANPQKQIPEIADDLRKQLPAFGYSPSSIEQTIQNILINLTQGLGNAAQGVNNAVDQQLNPQQPNRQAELLGAIN